jgi:ribonuclease inhibitor
MKTVFLDGDLADRVALLHRLAEHLDFPPHAAANLDALWDVLRTDVEGPFEIVWRDHEAARAAMGTDFEKIVSLLAQLAEERRDFAFRLA